MAQQFELYWPARGQRFSIPPEAKVVVLGRGPEADIRLPVATVSARHARLVHRDDGWWLEDLGSTNGTFLNDQPVRRSMRLKPGDRIRLGQRVVLVWRIASEAPTSLPPKAAAAASAPKPAPTQPPDRPRAESPARAQQTVVGASAEALLHTQPSQPAMWLVVTTPVHGPRSFLLAQPQLSLGGHE
ncbi:MAG: FHA domain-containing protein, partial [Chloroflexi bacterium]|nr:FHA domain-containing protein [Chloroflexota bacterium]